MSATEVLRAMLDERGVEWGNVRNDGSESDYLTEWQFEDNQGKAIATEWAVGSGLSVEIHRYHLTPAQAIAATLGESMTDTEKAALERRIDELCAEVERLHTDQAHWELGNCPSCPNVADLQEALDENAKLRELVSDMWHDGMCECDERGDCTTCEYGYLDRMRELGVTA